MLSPEQKQRRDHVYKQIESLWAQGLTDSQIAKTLGVSKSQVGVKMSRMRAQGCQLPYRHDEERRMKIRHGRYKGR